MGWPDPLNQRKFPPSEEWKDRYGLTEQQQKEFEYLRDHEHLPDRAPATNPEGVFRTYKGREKRS